MCHKVEMGLSRFQSDPVSVLSASHRPEGRIGVRQKHGGKGGDQETLSRVFPLGKVRRGGIDKTEMTLVR